MKQTQKRNSADDFVSGLGWLCLFIFAFPIMLPLVIIGAIVNVGPNKPLFHSKLWRNQYKNRGD